MDPQLQSFVNWCTSAVSAINSLDASNTTLTQNVADANAALAAAQSQLSAAQAQVDTLTQQQSADTATIAALNAQITDLNNQIASLKAQLAAVPPPPPPSLPVVEPNDVAYLNVLLGRRPETVLAGLHKLPAKTTDAVEVPGVWIDSGGHTAQSNPSISTIPHGTFTWTPGTDASPARIVFTPAAGWDDIYIYERFPLPATLPAYVSDLRTFSLTPADRAAVNCIEWQQEYNWAGKTYNLGWQWNFPSKMFKYFDYNTKVWKQATGVPWVDLGTTPVTIMTEHILDSVNGTTTHLALNINGTRYPVNATQPATVRTGVPNKYTISLLQMDSNSHGTPFGVNIHNCESRYIL